MYMYSRSNETPFKRQPSKIRLAFIGLFTLFRLTRKISFISGLVILPATLLAFNYLDRSRSKPDVVYKYLQMGFFSTHAGTLFAILKPYCMLYLTPMVCLHEYVSLVYNTLESNDEDMVRGVDVNEGSVDIIESEDEREDAGEENKEEVEEDGFVLL